MIRGFATAWRRSPLAVRAGLLVALCWDAVAIHRAVVQPASDVRTYREWITGPLPSWTVPGPYPLGADLLWWPLRWVPKADANLWWFLLFTGPVTVVACVVLWRTAARPVAAVTVWLAAAALLERSYWMRLEPVAALAALLMVVGLRRHRTALPALALTAGALVKVWPAFLLVTPLAALRGRRRWRFAAWFAVPWGVYGLAVLLLQPGHATTWLTFTFTRRTQAESLSALPALWAMAAGDHTWQLRYVGGLDSADVVLGPHLHASRWLLQAVGVVVLAALAVRVGRALRARAASGRPDPLADRDGLALVLGAQVAAMLVIVFAGPVFSPQYLVWFAAPLAIAAGEGLLGREVLVWLVGCGLTFLEFPVLWIPIRDADPLGVAVLTARDAVLVGLLVLLLRRLAGLTRTPAEPSRPRPAPVGR